MSRPASRPIPRPPVLADPPADLLRHAWRAFPWSVSGHVLHRTCPRAWYWQAVAGRGAFQPMDPDPRFALAWALRHLLTLPETVVRVVRTAWRIALGHAVTGGRIPTAARLSEGAQFTLAQVWLGSVDDAGHRRFWSAPANYPALAEALIGEGLPPGSLEQARDEVERAIRALVTSPALDVVQRHRPRAGGYQFPQPVEVRGDVVVWASPDAVVRLPAGRRGRQVWQVLQFTVGDPGRGLPTLDMTVPGELRASAAVAALWIAAATAHVTAAPSDLVLSEVDLATGVECRHRLDADDTAWLATQISRDVAVVGAAPRREGETWRDVITPERFPQRPSPAKCAICRFAPLCPTGRGVSKSETLPERLRMAPTLPASDEGGLWAPLQSDDAGARPATAFEA